MPFPWLTSFSDARYLSLRSLPNTPDGRYDYETSQNKYLASISSHSSFTNFVRKISSLSDKHYPDVERAFEGVVDQSLHPTAVDDRKGAFAASLGLLSALDPNDPIARALSVQGVNTLYNTVPHPPAAFLGPSHCFRAADGGCNCLDDSDRGRAGTSYARSVQSQFSAPLTSLPDPGLIFDALLKRQGIKDHPGGASSFTFAFATIVTHSIFMTNMTDWSRNDTSSYLDLSPLYGHNQAAQDLVRDKQSGRGLLYPDTFSEYRLFFLPPAASAILVILSRNHNYIAERLLKINENGRWQDPPPPPEDPRGVQQDEEIFQTARLINCGHFMSLIIGDYAAGFLGLSEGQFWEIPAFEEMRLRDGKQVGRGRGNHVSVEFNLLYRWHATISKPDQEWTDRQLSAVFKKPFHEITMKDFEREMKELMKKLERYPNRRTFAGLERDADNRFSDDQLARILQDATETPGGAWRAHGTPEALRIVEILSIEQAREWGVCTMNEFRQFLGLKQFESFEEWNSDKEVAGAARFLYGHINNLELYVGLQAEETMPVTPGSRIAAGYTTVRAVLGDAIAMVRGDRFYTTDFTPANLTAWGYQDCMRDPFNGGFGGEMPKLLMRALPRHYPHNNVYGLFPFFTPKYMHESLQKQGRAADYVFDRPPTGPNAHPPQVINTRAGIMAITETSVGMRVGAQANIGGSFNFDIPVRPSGRVLRKVAARKSLAERPPDDAWALKVMFPNSQTLPKYCKWFRETATRNIESRSWKYGGVPGRYVDIVTGVITATAVEWAAEHLCGIPLKTAQNERGIYTEQEMYDKFSLLFKAMFLSEREPENTFSLLYRAREERKLLADLIADAIVDIKPGAAPTILSNLASSIANLLWRTPRKKCQDFLGLLASSNDPLDTLTAAAMGMAVCSAMNIIQTTVLVIDFYLDEKRIVDILRLVSADIANSDELLIGYVREAMRLNPPVSGLYVNVPEDIEIPQAERTPAMSANKGERVWASHKNAQINPADFPRWNEVDPRRPHELYLPTPTHFMGCPGQAFVEQIVAEFVRVVFSRKGIRRAPGFAGQLIGFTTDANQTTENWFITPTGAADAFPGSMQLIYDA